MVLSDAVALSRQLHRAGSDPFTDVTLLDEILGFYRLIYKTGPGGSENVEVMEKLLGKNERNVVIFPSDHPSLTDEGVLLDRWRTPYFFHNISREIMDITSAGPDGILHTGDDVTLGLGELAAEEMQLLPTSEAEPEVGAAPVEPEVE